MSGHQEHTNIQLIESKSSEKQSQLDIVSEWHRCNAMWKVGLAKHNKGEEIKKSHRTQPTHSDIHVQV